jgi:peptidoglycan/xylan/chitin deacetylase (PgdA/CDA1 family)
MILMYHNIENGIDFNTISVKDFEDSMLYLKSNPLFEIVDFKNYINYLDTPSSRKIITLTFDDAYSSIKSHVLPIIRDLQIPIIIFVPVNKVGKYNTWDTVNDQKRIEILSWSEIKELQKESLITFGSHGSNHISFNKLDLANIRSELQESKSILENELDCKIDYFSYPFGQLRDMGSCSNRILREAGYKAAVTTIWSRKNSHKNLYALNRIEIRHTDTLEHFKTILTRQIDLKGYKQQLKNILFKLKIYK